MSSVKDKLTLHKSVIYNLFFQTNWENLPPGGYTHVRLPSPLGTLPPPPSPSISFQKILDPFLWLQCERAISCPAKYLALVPVKHSFSYDKLNPLKVHNNEKKVKLRTLIPRPSRGYRATMGGLGPKTIAY